MRIAVFGATGMAGTAIVNQALARGHYVTAVSRHPEHSASSASHPEQLVRRSADLADAETVASVLADVDAAVLAVRLAAGRESQLAPLTRTFLDLAQRHDTRVLIVGGAAPLRSPNGGRAIDDPAFVPPAWQPIARASLEQFHSCWHHPYGGWVYLSPPAILELGAATGSYRRGTDTLLTNDQGMSRIAAPDLALAVVDELTLPGEDQHFTVGALLEG